MPSFDVLRRPGVLRTTITGLLAVVALGACSSSKAAGDSDPKGCVAVRTWGGVTDVSQAELADRFAHAFHIDAATAKWAAGGATEGVISCNPDLDVTLVDSGSTITLQRGPTADQGDFCVLVGRTGDDPTLGDISGGRLTGVPRAVAICATNADVTIGRLS